MTLEERTDAPLRGLAVSGSLRRGVGGGRPEPTVVRLLLGLRRDRVRDGYVVGLCPFDAVLSGMLDSVAAGPALILAALVIFVIRPTMLALLVVQANIPGSELLLATIGVVVMASITVHGGSATPLSAWYARQVVSETLAEERENTAAGFFSAGGNEVPRITPEALSGLLAEANPPALLDVRSRSSYESDGAQIPGSIRVLPDQIIDWASDCPEFKLVVTYCT